MLADKRHTSKTAKPALAQQPVDALLHVWFVAGQCGLAAPAAEVVAAVESLVHTQPRTVVTVGTVICGHSADKGGTVRNMKLPYSRARRALC